MTEETSPLHIRLEYGEAIGIRKDVLTSEMDLILVLKAINKYSELRKQEIELKTSFYKLLKNISIKIKNMEKSLPQLEIPKILKTSQRQRGKYEEKLTITPEVKVPSRRSKMDAALEQQLLEIQRKIQSLS